MSELFKTCDHCGTPFAPKEREDRFCCSGCQFVNSLISSNGLTKFYDLKGRETLLPVGNGVLLKPDCSWAEGIQESAEAALEAHGNAAGLAEARMDLQGVSCIGCVWLIDAAFAREPGAGRAVVDATRGTLTLSWFTGKFDLAAFAERLGQFGYRIAPFTEGEKASGASGLKLGLCGALAMNAMAFTLPRYVGMGSNFALADLFEMIAAFSATLSLFVGGGYFIQRAWNAIRLKRLHLDVPISIGVIAAWLGSMIGWFLHSPGLLYFDFVAVFIFLMLLGRRLQEVSVARNRNRLLRADPTLHEVEVREGEDWKRRSVSSLEAGNEFKVMPGGVVPVPSELLASEASLSLEWITGESEVVTWNRGTIVPAGAIQLAQLPVAFKAHEAWEGSLLERLRTATADAGNDPAAKWLDRTLRIYLSIILLTAVIGAVAWMWKGAGWPAALQVFVSVLVVSCPCALGVAVPMAHELAVARLRQLGLFVRSPDLWGRLLRVKKMVFDKTGTLTLDTPTLTNPEALDALSEPGRQVLCQLVGSSRHPVSSALREVLASKGIFTSQSASPVEEIPGHGPRLTTRDDTLWELRRPGDWESGDVIFTSNGNTLAAFHFTEQLRGDAPAEVELLRKRGLEVHLLSGDKEAKVQRMAASLSIPTSQALSRQTPEDKGNWMRRNGKDALFIGDGANDSLAAKEALCSGTLAVERSMLAEHTDFYFLSRSLRPLRLLLEMARVRRSAVRRAFAFALIYNLAVLVLALAGRMNPLLAAILMPLSSVATLVIVRLSYSKKA